MCRSLESLFLSSQSFKLKICGNRNKATVLHGLSACTALLAVPIHIPKIRSTVSSFCPGSTRCISISRIAAACPVAILFHICFVSSVKAVIPPRTIAVLPFIRAGWGTRNIIIKVRHHPNQKWHPGPWHRRRFDVNEPAQCNESK